MQLPDIVGRTIVHGSDKLPRLAEQLTYSLQRISCCRYRYRAIPDRTCRAHQRIEQT
ncbi:hypothetical protein D3C86_2133110 [compost metagenome]